MEIHRCNIQSKLDTHIPFCNTLLFRKSVTNTGIRLYSMMPDLIKKIGQDQTFTGELKSFLLTTCILFSGCISIIMIAYGFYKYLTLISYHIYILTYSTGQSPSWEANRFSAQTFYGTQRFINAFTSACHLFLSWATSILSMSPHPTSWWSILILSSYLSLGLPSGLLLSGSTTKPLYTLLLSPI